MPGAALVVRAGEGEGAALVPVGHGRVVVGHEDGVVIPAEHIDLGFVVENGGGFGGGPGDAAVAAFRRVGRQRAHAVAQPSHPDRCA